MRPTTRPEPSEASLVPRVFAILGAFRDRPVQGASELSRRTGIPRTTVHRLLIQLAEQGALARVGTGYRLGPTMLELGALHYPPRLRDSIDPFLVDLQRLTGGEVALCELVERDVIVIHAVHGRSPGTTRLPLGARLPAHACAAGKVALAHARRLPYGRGEDLRAVTARTTTSATALRTQLVEIRRTGLSVERGEAIDGYTSVGAPVTNRHGRVLGALMALVPADRLDLEALGDAVGAVARTLTLAGQTANIDFLARAHPAPAS